MTRCTAFVVLALGWAAGVRSQESSFQGLGDLPGGGSSSLAADVSADGSVVVGVGLSAGGFEAFRWTAATGMVGLGDIPGGNFQSEALGVSADGNVVVGYGMNPAGDREPFRWTSAGLVALGGFPDVDPDGEARGASADGAVVVGFLDQQQAQDEAFRWAGSISGLGFLPDGFDSGADDISADGAVVVGWAEDGGGTLRPVRWSSGAIQILGDLPGGDAEGEAWAVSADGSTAVGFSSSAAGDQAFRWSAGGMVPLGFLPGGQRSEAHGVSADGRVVVGESATPSGPRAFIWTAAGGMRDLKSVLENDHGLDLTGWTLTRAYAVSDDGTTIVGAGGGPSGTQGWRAVMPLCAAARWQNPAGGAFSDPANWIGGDLPSATRLAAFGFPEPASYIVGFAADQSSAGLQVYEGNEVRLLLGSRTYTLREQGDCEGTLVVSRPGRPRLRIQEGTVRSEAGLYVSGGSDPAGGDDDTAITIGAGGRLDVTAGAIVIGDDPAEYGAIAVESGGILNLVASDPDGLLIGRAGIGSIDVGAGGQATLSATGGFRFVSLGVTTQASLSLGDIRVSGAGATLTVEPLSVLVVGREDSGRMFALDGATISAGSAAIGFDSGSTGGLFSRAGSHVTLARLIAGREGWGIVGVETGGLITVIGDMDAPSVSGLGEIEVKDEGSVLAAARLRLGVTGTGRLVVREAGRVQAGVFVPGAQATLNTAGGCLQIGGTPCGMALAGAGGLVVVDSLWLAAGAVVDSTTTVLGQGGVLGGSGTLSAGLTNAGAINPGDSADVAGTFTIGGAYAQAPDGALEIELGGTAAGAYDHLAVVGAATLDGTLRFSHIGGFTPAPGDMFDVLSAGSVTGAFAGVEGPPGCTYSLAYGPTTVTATVLTVAAEPPPGAPGLVLHAPAPNPVAGLATIRYELPAAGHVRMTLHDALGREVAVLVDDHRQPGAHEAHLDALRLSPGAYIARLLSERALAVHRFTVIR